MFVPRPGSHRTVSGPRLAATLAVLGASLVLAATSSAQVSRNVTLLSHMHEYTEYSACWSYVHTDGREYVVINALDGASIVRLTDPANPVEVAFIPLVDTFWHEVKQYRNYLYITTDCFDCNGHRALEIIDMRDPDRPRRGNGFNPNLGFIHTVTVDEERGLLFLNGMPPEVHTDEDMRRLKLEVEQGQRHLDHSFGSMHIYSLADPERPAELAVYNEYVHDLHVRGTRGYASLIYDGFIAVLDLTDPSHPVELTRWETPNEFTHSAWTSEDGRTLYVCDETEGPNSLSVWDIADLANPRLTYLHEELPGEVPHNPRVRGDQLFISHYTAGVRVWDLTNPAWPVETGWYDTFPGPNGSFNGNWEVAPYYPSGIFVLSDIQTGLYVMRHAPKNYGIVRGTVREASNGPPIPGVLVTANPGGRTFRTHTDGTFAFALDAPGSYTFTFSLFRFEPETRSVSNVSVGSDRTLNVTMRRTPTGTVQGIVSNQDGGTPIAGAELSFDGFPMIPGTMSGTSGSYRLEAIPIGTYTLRCMGPGFVPAAQSLTVTSGATVTADFPLTAAAYYDDAETDRGWSLADPTDDATRGLWIRAVPLPAVLFNGFVTQPGEDHTPGAGTTCFVTGNHPDPRFVGSQAVFGTTTLTSPAVSLAGLPDPRVGFWVWYTNELGLGDIPNDVLLLRLSGDGGTTWVTAASVTRNTRGWRYFEIHVRDHLPTASTVRLKVIASENDFSLVEALLDDFAVYSGGAGPSPAARLVRSESAPSSDAAVAFRGVGPVPSRGAVRAALELRRAAEVRADVFDVRGRLVRSVDAGRLPAGRQGIVWDGRLNDGTAAGSGVYWMRLRAGGLERTMKVVLTR